MAQIRCPSCSKTLKIGPELAGKIVGCPCGKRLKVPSIPGRQGHPVSASPAQQPMVSAASAATTSAAPLTADCTCGKRLRVPESAVGKAVKCPCGSIIRVPATASPATASPAAGSPAEASHATVPVARAVPQAPVLAPAPAPAPDDFFDDLPMPAGPSSYANYASPTPIYGNASAYQTPQATSAQSNANSVLAEARRDLAREGRRAPSGESMFNGSTFTGLAMIAGAIIWFVAGLFAGVIFFYPPIMLILGIITFFKGLMGGED